MGWPVPMSRILFTWELGAGMGHLATIRSIAVPLISAGHQVCVALRDLGRAHQFFGDLPVHFHQAPFFQGIFPDSFHPPATFPHVLYNCCCGDPQVFCSLAKAWQQLFIAVEPDLVLFDHSPTAIFASRNFRFRRATIGNGFFSPPDQSPLPSWRRETLTSPAECIVDEQRVLTSLNVAARTLGQAELPRVSSLYAELDANYLTTYPELDHFEGRGQGNYVGTWAAAFGKRPCWPESTKPKVFAYLKKFKTLPVVLYHLVQLQLPTILYAPGALNDEFLRRFRNSQTNMQVAEEPVDLEQAAEECDFAITNGTHGTVTAMFRAGKPTINAPLNLEQRILCERLSELGTGITISPDDPSTVEQAFQTMLDSPQLAQAAAKYRQRYGNQTHRYDLPAFCEKINELLK